MRQNLLDWQWKLYPDGHTRKLTLVIHVMTVPLFMSGTLMVVASPLLGWHFALAGALFMIATVMMQGWSHKQEDAKPVAFLGPLDFVSRFFVEQWVTFPRFLFSGAVARAWQKAR
jgi:hypothetical protein